MRQRRDDRHGATEHRANLVLAWAVAGALALTFSLVALAATRNDAPAAPPKAARPAMSAPVASAATESVPATIATASAPVTPPPATKPKTAQAPRPAAAAKKPVPAPTIPERMSRVLPGSTQLVVAVTPKLSARDGKLYIFDKRGSRWVQVFSATARFGFNGLSDGQTRREGTRTTPTGIWWMGPFGFGWHASPPSGTRMPYRQATASSWWSYQRDPTYNTWVESSSHVDGEHLASVRVQYEYALSTGYNAPPNQRVIGRGSAIFLHIFDPPDYHEGYSAGCVAVSRDDIIRVFRILDPARKPTFAVGTLAAGTPTSIYAF